MIDLVKLSPVTERTFTGIPGFIRKPVILRNIIEPVIWVHSLPDGEVSVDVTATVSAELERTE